MIRYVHTCRRSPLIPFLAVLFCGGLTAGETGGNSDQQLAR